jgi:hypothetical protein
MKTRNEYFQQLLEETFPGETILIGRPTFDSNTFAPQLPVKIGSDKMMSINPETFTDAVAYGLDAKEMIGHMKDAIIPYEDTVQTRYLFTTYADEEEKCLKESGSMKIWSDDEISKLVNVHVYAFPTILVDDKPYAARSRVFESIEEYVKIANTETVGVMNFLHKKPNGIVGRLFFK